MKVLVYFSSEKHKANFEGDRLRKTIAGALNRSEVEYALEPNDTSDIVHLVSPEDVEIAEAANDKGIPVVYSALYTEGDPKARFVDKKTGIAPDSCTWRLPFHNERNRSCNKRCFQFQAADAWRRPCCRNNDDILLHTHVYQHAGNWNESGCHPAC